MITAPAEQVDRQLSAQYPSREAIERSSIMVYFNNEQNEAINQMWISVRCYNINDVPVWAWILTVCAIALVAVFWVRNAKRRG